MQINELYAVYQHLLVGLCLIGLAALLLVLLFEKYGNIFHLLYTKWLHLDGFGRIVSVVMLCSLTYYGATKGWNPVQSGGGDTTLQVTGIYTITSNEVVEVEGVTTTNELYMVRVEWLGIGGDTNTPVSIRHSETNEWTELVKLDPIQTLEGGVTNRIDFHTESNMASTAYWWFGVDRPAIVITAEGIEIREFEVTSRKVRIWFVCDEQEATVFYIRRKEVGKANWETVGMCIGSYGVISKWEGQMFTVDKTYDWQVMTTVEEGEDDE